MNVASQSAPQFSSETLALYKSFTYLLKFEAGEYKSSSTNFQPTSRISKGYFRKIPGQILWIFIQQMNICGLDC